MVQFPLMQRTAAKPLAAPPPPPADADTHPRGRKAKSIAAIARMSTLAKRSSSGASVAARWEHFSAGMQVEADAVEVCCVEEQGTDTCACAVGPLLPLSGHTEVCIRILASDGSGSSMLVGVAEDLGAFPHTGGTWGRAFGLAPWSGRLFGFPDARARDKARTGEVRGAALMGGDMRGIATGATIRLRVDMREQRLFVKATDVDGWTLARDSSGQPLSLAPAAGSVGWRPLVRCARAGDRFAMGPLTHTPLPEVHPPPGALPMQPSPRSKTLPASLPAVNVPHAAFHRGEPEALERQAARELLAAREQVDVLRTLYLAEKEARFKAEQARDVAVRQYEKEKQLREQLSRRMQSDPELAEQQRRVHEIETALLHEAMVHNEKARNSIAESAGVAIAAAQGNRWRASALRAAALQERESGLQAPL